MRLCATCFVTAQAHNAPWLTASGGDAFRCALLGRVGAHAHQRFADALLDYVLEDYPGRQVRTAAPVVCCALCGAEASSTAVRATRTSFSGFTAFTPMTLRSSSLVKSGTMTKHCLPPLEACCASFLVRGARCTRACASGG